MFTYSYTVLWFYIPSLLFTNKYYSFGFWAEYEYYQTWRLENGTIYITMMKNWVSHILFLRKGGWRGGGVSYQEALKKGAIGRHIRTMSHIGSYPPPLYPSVKFERNSCGGVQWLSGRVLDSRPKGRGFRASPASLRCGPWARHIYPCLVLVQPRKTRPYITERLLMGRKESNQTNKSCIPSKVINQKKQIDNLAKI